MSKIISWTKTTACNDAQLGHKPAAAQPSPRDDAYVNIGCSGWASNKVLLRTCGASQHLAACQLCRMSLPIYNSSSFINVKSKFQFFVVIYLKKLMIIEHL